MSLLHLVSFPYSTPIATNKVFRSVLMWLDRIFCWCTTVSAIGISINIALANMTRNAIHGVFMGRVSNLFCSCLSSAFVDSIVWSVDWFI